MSTSSDDMAKSLCAPSLGRLIARSLRERPEDWSWDCTDPADGRPFFLTHALTGRQLWIASGRGSYRERDRLAGDTPWPKIGFLDQFRVHRAVEGWLAAYGPAPKPKPADPKPSDFGFADDHMAASSHDDRESAS